MNAKGFFSPCITVTQKLLKRDFVIKSSLDFLPVVFDRDYSSSQRNLDTLNIKFSTYFGVCVAIRLGAAGEAAGGRVPGSQGPGGLIQTR